MERRDFIRNSLAVLAPTMISGNPVFAIGDHPLLNLDALAQVNSLALLRYFASECVGAI